MAFKYLWSAVIFEELSWKMYFLSFTKLALWLKVDGRSGRMYAWGTSLAKRLLSVTMLLLLMVVMFFSCHAWNWLELATSQSGVTSMVPSHSTRRTTTSIQALTVRK